MRKKSTPVDFEHDDLQTYLDHLKDTLHHLQEAKKIGRAIAAPQIGIFKKIIYMESGQQRIILINPNIIDKSKEMFEVWDSCFSADVAFMGKTLRHREITVEHFDEKLNKKTSIFQDDLSELFQHEIDHLNGILFVDRIVDNQIIMRSEWEKLSA